MTNKNSNPTQQVTKVASRAISTRPTSTRNNNSNINAKVKTNTLTVQQLADQAYWPQSRQGEIQGLKELLKQFKESIDFWKDVASSPAVWDFWRQSSDSLRDLAIDVLKIQCLCDSIKSEKKIDLSTPVIQLIKLGQPLDQLESLLSQLNEDESLTQKDLLSYQTAFTHLARLNVLPHHIMKQGPKVFLLAVTNYVKYEKQTKGRGQGCLDLSCIDKNFELLAKKLSRLGPDTQSFHTRYLNFAEWAYGLNLDASIFEYWASSTTTIVDVFNRCKSMTPDQRSFIKKYLSTLLKHPEVKNIKAMDWLFQNNLNLFATLISWIGQNDPMLVQKAFSLIPDHCDELVELIDHVQDPNEHTYNLFVLIEAGLWNRPTKRGRKLFKEDHTLDTREFENRLLPELKRDIDIQQHLAAVSQQVNANKAPWKSTLRDLLFLPIDITRKTQLLSLVARFPHLQFAKSLISWIKNDLLLQEIDYQQLSERTNDLPSLIHTAQTLIERGDLHEQKSAVWASPENLLSKKSASKPHFAKLLQEIKSDPQFGPLILDFITGWIRAKLTHELFQILPNDYSKLSDPEKQQLIYDLTIGLMGHHDLLIEEKNLPTTSLRYQVLQHLDLKSNPEAFVALMRRSDLCTLTSPILSYLTTAPKNFAWDQLLILWDQLQATRQTDQLIAIHQLFISQSPLDTSHEMKNFMELLMHRRVHEALNFLHASHPISMIDSSPMNPLPNKKTLSKELAVYDRALTIEKYGIIQAPDRKSLSQAFLHDTPYYFTTYHWVQWGVKLAKPLIDAKVSIYALEDLLKAEFPKSLTKTDHLEHVKRTLELIKGNRNLRQRFRTLPKNFVLSDLGKRIVQKVLGTDKEPTPKDIQTVLLSALLYWPRQTDYEGSCFTDAMIIFQHSHVQGLERILDDYLQILSQEALSVTSSSNPFLKTLPVHEKFLYLDLKRLPEHPLAKARKLALSTLGVNPNRSDEVWGDAISSLQSFWQQAALTPADRSDLAFEIRCCLKRELVLFIHPQDIASNSNNIFVWRACDLSRKKFIYTLDDYVEVLSNIILNVCSSPSCVKFHPLVDTIPAWTHKTKASLEKDFPDVQSQEHFWAPGQTGGWSSALLRDYYRSSLGTYATHIRSSAELAEGLSNYLFHLTDLSLWDTQAPPSLFPIAMPGHALNLLPEEILKTGSPQNFLERLQKHRDQLDQQACSIETQHHLNTALGLAGIMPSKEQTLGEWAKQALCTLCLASDNINYQMAAEFIDAVLCKNKYLTDDMMIRFADLNWHDGDHKVIFAFGPSLTAAQGIRVFRLPHGQETPVDSYQPVSEKELIGCWDFFVPFQE